MYFNWIYTVMFIALNNRGVKNVFQLHYWQYKIDTMSILKIVSAYDQEIPQSQTADNPVALQGRAAQPSRDTRKTNQAKQPALSSPSR